MTFLKSTIVILILANAVYVYSKDDLVLNQENRHEFVDSKEYIETNLIPYISQILSSDSWEDLHEFLQKKGCSERLLQEHEKEFKENKPIKCKPSKASIFKNDDNFDMLKVSVISDFDTVNKNTSSPAVARIQDGEKEEFIPIQIATRGNSRGRHCTWKPQRWSFFNKETVDQVKAAVKEKKEDETNEAFLKRYLESINEPKTEGKKDRDNIFGKIGDDVKLVTHCGTTGWDQISADTPAGQKERILKEFLIYQMLDEMKTSLIKVRLAEITYLSPDGEVLEQNIGFFREPRGAMAKRCNLINDQKRENGKNEASALQAKLFNNFVYSMDFSLGGHNMHILKNKEGQYMYGPYDFDLSGIFAHDYRKNTGGPEKGSSRFEEFLEYQKNSPTSIVQVYALRRKIDRMKEIIEESPLQEESKEQFRTWIQLYTGKVDYFLAQAKENHPELLDSLITRDVQLRVRKEQKRLHKLSREEQEKIKKEAEDLISRGSNIGSQLIDWITGWF